MRITTKLLLPIFLALAHSISQAQINGQLFIVQRDQAVVKLALVTVSAYPDQQFSASFKETKDANNRTITTLSAELAEIKVKMREQREAIARDKELLRSIGEEPKATNTKPNYAERYEPYWNLYKKIEKTEDEMERDKERISEIEREIANLKSPEIYTKNLPNTPYRAKSNADGHFRLNVPRGIYIVVAKSSRVVFGDKTEEYLWMVRIDSRTGGSELLLTNDNLHETYCADCLH